LEEESVILKLIGKNFLARPGLQLHFMIDQKSPGLDVRAGHSGQVHGSGCFDDALDASKKSAATALREIEEQRAVTQIYIVLDSEPFPLFIPRATARRGHRGIRPMVYMLKGKVSSLRRRRLY
jgi:hypothetical protein